MPIYEYQCDGCSEVFEVFQKLSDPAPTSHSCGSTAVHRVLSNTTFVLKGTGWYQTDYAQKDKANAASRLAKHEGRERGDNAKKEGNDRGSKDEATKAGDSSAGKEAASSKEASSSTSAAKSDASASSNKTGPAPTKGNGGGGAAAA